MFGHSKNKNGCCMLPSCIVVWVIGIVAVFGFLTSLVAVILTHVLPEGLVFGTMNGNFSLLVLALYLFLMKKLLSGCCPPACCTGNGKK